MLSLILLPLLQKPLTFKQGLIMALTGAISLWFSYPAVFILAGFGLTSLIVNWLNKKSVNWGHYLRIYLTGLGSFILFYFLAIHAVSNDTALSQAWSDDFPESPWNIIWYIDAFGRFFYRPLGFTKWIDGLAIIALITGCVFLFKQNKTILGIIVSPILLTLIAAGLHQYPFQSRLVLFLMPVAIIAIGAGTLYLYRQSRHLILKILSIFLIAILIIPSAWESAQLMKNPIEKSEIKPVIAYIKEHQQPQDLLYIYQRGIYQFKYYAEQ